MNVESFHECHQHSSFQVRAWPYVRSSEGNLFGWSRRKKAARCGMEGFPSVPVFRHIYICLIIVLNTFKLYPLPAYTSVSSFDRTTMSFLYPLQKPGDFGGRRTTRLRTHRAEVTGFIGLTVTGPGIVYRILQPLVDGRPIRDPGTSSPARAEAFGGTRRTVVSSVRRRKTQRRSVQVRCDRRRTLPPHMWSSNIGIAGHLVFEVLNNFLIMFDYLR